MHDMTSKKSVLDTALDTPQQISIVKESHNQFLTNWGDGRMKRHRRSYL
jgi:hypothetical protein